jgi:hypothetical protein
MYRLMPHTLHVPSVHAPSYRLMPAFTPVPSVQALSTRLHSTDATRAVQEEHPYNSRILPQRADTCKTRPAC